MNRYASDFDILDFTFYNFALHVFQILLSSSGG